jgi:hypothetical protein
MDKNVPCSLKDLKRANPDSWRTRAAKATSAAKPRSNGGTGTPAPVATGPAAIGGGGLSASGAEVECPRPAEHIPAPHRLGRPSPHLRPPQPMSLCAYGDAGFRRAEDAERNERVNPRGCCSGVQSNFGQTDGSCCQRKIDMVFPAVREDIVAVAEQQVSAGIDDLDALQLFGNELQQICEHLSERPRMSVERAEAIGRVESIAQALLKMWGPQVP